MSADLVRPGGQSAVHVHRARNSHLRVVDDPAGWRASRRAGRREVRRRRIAGLLRLALFLFLVFAAVWAGVRVANAGIAMTGDGSESYVVRAGDTLWDIAVCHYGERVDPRRAVYEIRVANDLNGDVTLQPGDELALPYGGDWVRTGPLE